MQDNGSKKKTLYKRFIALMLFICICICTGAVPSMADGGTVYPAIQPYYNLDGATFNRGEIYNISFRIYDGSWDTGADLLLATDPDADRCGEDRAALRR